MHQLVQFLSSRAGGAVVAALVAVAVAVPVTAFASHQFSDVSDAHPFHHEISAVAGAGITTGFSDGTFRPSNAVTRQAMSAFFERGAGRISYSPGALSAEYLNAGERSMVAQTTVHAGAAQSGSGFVHLVGHVQARVTGETNLARCPCQLQVTIEDAAGRVGHSRSVTTTQVPGTPTETTIGHQAWASAAVQHVMPLEADAIRTYRLVASTADIDAQNIALWGTLTATYVPLSGDGDSTLERSLTCPADDGYEQNDTAAAASTHYVDVHDFWTFSAIVCPGDDDWYISDARFEVGDRVEVEVQFLHEEGNIDVCLYHDTTLITCSETKTDNEALTHTVTTAGRYSLQVHLREDYGKAAGNLYSTLFQRARVSGG